MPPKQAKRKRNDEQEEPQPEEKPAEKKREKKYEQKSLNSFAKINENEEAKKPAPAPGGNTVTIWHWNVNGIRAILNRAKLKEFIKQANVGILCLNETKIDDKALSSENIKTQLSGCFPIEHQYFNCCKPPNKGYAGSAILVNPNVAGLQPLKVTYDIGVNKHDQEGRVTTVEFERFFLVAVYVPNAGVKGLNRLDYRVKEWDRDFHKYLKDLEVNNNKPVIVCGDLNVAHHEIDIFGPKGKERNAGFTKEERESFGKFLTNCNFVDTFRHFHPKQVKYSYFNERSGAKQKYQGWRLDYFCTSAMMLDAVVASDIANEYNGSDHDPLFMTIDMDRMGGNFKKEEKKKEDDGKEKAEAKEEKNGKKSEKKAEKVEMIKKSEDKKKEKEPEKFDQID